MSFRQPCASLFEVGNEKWGFAKCPYSKTPEIIANSPLYTICRFKLAQSEGENTQYVAIVQVHPLAPLGFILRQQFLVLVVTNILDGRHLIERVGPDR